MLLNAICTELEATLFDLTATNIVGRYPGKSGLNMLLHLVLKVSRLVQPAIIFIDQAEKTFLKKVSKTDKSDPKRLKKDLPRLVRSLSSEDCVMLIGASRLPWECEQKGENFKVYLPFCLCLGCVNSKKIGPNRANTTISFALKSPKQFLLQDWLWPTRKWCVCLSQIMHFAATSGKNWF